MNKIAIQLSQISDLIKERQECEERLAQIREGKLCSTYSQCTARSTVPIDRVGTSALAAMELEQTLESIKTRLFLEETDLRKKIAGLEDSVLRRLFTLRYIDCRKWVEVSFMMDYSVDNIYKLHSKGIKILENKCLQ